MVQQIQDTSLSSDIDSASIAIDLIRTATDSNTAVHIVDPRGLQVAKPRLGLLEDVASGSGGETHSTNDMVDAVRRMLKQSSAVYLLGYTRDVPADGRFHEIKVRVKHGGYDVRSRAGYWAPRADDVEHAKTAAAAAVLPPALAAAFASLAPAGSPRLVDFWVGSRPRSGGGSDLMLAWSRLNRASAEARPASVSVSVKSGDRTVFDGAVPAAGTTVEVPSGMLKIAVLVSSESGEIVDRFSTSVDVPVVPASGLLLGTPLVSIARTPAEARAVLASPSAPPIHAGREFVRTDRLIMHTSAYGPAAAAASVGATLVDKRGATLVNLPVKQPSGTRDYQIDLPLASIAAGDFVVSIVAANGDARAEVFVPVRVVR